MRAPESPAPHGAWRFIAGIRGILVASLLARARLVTTLLLIIILVHLVKLLHVELVEVIADLERLDCDPSQLKGSWL